ncbi:hypothetical protein [Pseudomonas sp. PDM13]|uniref:hypothetical protein n=1 Tax=Pseudomonas sp. PDM13 TaxID=2769255 RepID=UPI0021DFFDED|nr:hypothetical protein [Pseudomonas sp. PDM13]MCU9949875.1 hypothetical protein [Pseudomonas sp. PDM13]
MNNEISYQGLAFVSFESLSESSSVELIEIILSDHGNSIFELRSTKQLPARRVTITPVNQLSMQGTVLSQSSGVTIFRISEF